MTHTIKLNKNFCDAVLSGEKNFELRKNDRGYQKGDNVVFIPVTDLGTPTTHPIEEKMFMITYVINGYGLENGYVAFGIKPGAY